MADNTGYAPLGKVGIRPRGKWVIGTLYEKLDIVSHNGSSYLALIDNSVEPSDDGVNWMLIARGASSELLVDAETLGGKLPEYYAAAESVGVLENLSTEAKTSLVDAINEVSEKSGISDVAINENMVLNSNFRLNETGNSEYTGTGVECVTKWEINAIYENVTVYHSATGPLKMVYGGGDSYSGIWQKINEDLVAGEQYALTVKVAALSGTVHAFLNMTDEPYEGTSMELKAGINKLEYEAGYSAAHKVFIAFETAGEISVEYVKLERGSFSTYIEPDEELERVRCGLYATDKELASVAVSFSNQINGVQQSLNAQMDSRFNGVNASLGEAHSKANAATAGITALEAGLNTATANITTLQTGLETANTNINTANTNIAKKADSESPTFTGAATFEGTARGAAGTDYTTARFRNAVLTQSEPTSPENGTIYFIY